MRGVLALAVGGLIVLALVDVANAQPDRDVAPLLRVEWQRTAESWRRPALEGFVYNDSSYRVGSLRLRIEALNASNQVVSEALSWVYSSVPSGGRTHFRVPLVPGGETFRITIESFRLIARESPGEAP